MTISQRVRVESLRDFPSTQHDKAMGSKRILPAKDNVLIWTSRRMSPMKAMLHLALVMNYPVN